MGRHTKKSHAEYLAGDHWRTLRLGYLSEQPWCERCSMPRWLAAIAYGQDLNVHHRHYRTLGRERSEDLEALCLRCHELETFGRSDLIAAKSAICALCGSTHWDPRAEMCQTCDQAICSEWLWNISDFARDRIAETIAKIRGGQNAKLKK